MIILFGSVCLLHILTTKHIYIYTPYKNIQKYLKIQHIIHHSNHDVLYSFLVRGTLEKEENSIVRKCCTCGRY